MPSSPAQQPLFDTYAPLLTLPDCDPIPEIDQLVADVAGFDTTRFGGLCNFFAGDDAAAKWRRDNLRRYLAARRRADVLLVGEAAGYLGARISGIAFTSEHQLTGRPGTSKETSATIVHKTLAALGAEHRVLLWNTVPFHPHQVGQPRSNRAPKPAEVAACATFIERLSAGRTVIAVGRVASALTGAGYIRHPAHGGATAFAAGLAQALAAGGS